MLNRTLVVTLTKSILTLKGGLLGMINRKSDCIVNIGTVNAKAMTCSVSYRVAKAGIHALTRTVAVRYSRWYSVHNSGPWNYGHRYMLRASNHNPQNSKTYLEPWYLLVRVGTPANVSEAGVFII